MRLNFVRKEIREYIENEIKPQYKYFDKAHNISHFKFVTKNCIDYGTELIKRGLDINLEMAYVVGAFHDIGISIERENHAKHSGEIVRNDKKLKEFYSNEEIEIIAQAVEDHSSHLEYEPRNIYGKIVADADRNNSMYLVFARPIKFGLKHEPENDRQTHIDRVFEFVNKKFGRTGYVKYWLDIPNTTKAQQQIWELLDDEKTCKAYIAGILDETTKGKLAK